MKSRLYTVLAGILLCLAAKAQTVVEQGTITFERKKNMHKIITDSYGKSDWSEEIRKNTPKTRNDLFRLSFSGKQSLYIPLGEDDAKRSWIDAPAQRNTVYMDFSTLSIVCQKQVFENTYLVTDSIPSIRWRITNEYREVAGYMCRKATAIIMDSVYVIAFYTDALLTPAGPESFNGLPGMILGIAIPRMHTTWFATKVETAAVDKSTLKPPTKGIKTTYAGLSDTLRKSLESWKDYLNRVFWNVFL